MYIVFISTPMSGKDKKEVERRLIAISRKAIEAACKKFGWDENLVWWCANDNCPEPGPMNKRKNVFCLGESIKKMSSVDCIYFDEGWEHANGCLVERFVALEYEIPVLFYNIGYGGKKNEEKEE